MILLNGYSFPCALGVAGITTRKREGDHATPAGIWPMRCVFYRPDRVKRPQTGLDTYAICPSDGWCDAGNDPFYNRPVTLPYPASAERMWRDDRLYDIVVVLGHNDTPCLSGHGSCIFFHIARPDFAPTEGCVAAAPDVMPKLLKHCSAATALHIS